jgi:ATP-dependent helicase/nuclease subunit A
MSNLTKEQQQVVTTTGKNLLVSASAGSGKTYTMIKRILHLISNEKANIKDMLIVTFTNAAASEMKQKIYENIAEQAKENENLKEQLDAISTADISTLHTFCSKIIKQYFYEVGVDPAFKVLEDKEAQILQNDSLNAVLNGYIKKDDVEFNTLFETYNKKRRDVEFKNSILNIYSFLKTKYDYKSFIKQVVHTTYNDQLNTNLVAHYFNNSLLELIEHFTIEFNKYNQRASEIKSEKLQELTLSILATIKSIKTTNTVNQNIKALINIGSFSSIPSKVADDEKPLKEEIKQDKQELKKVLDSFKAMLGGDNIEQVKQHLVKAKPNLLKMLEVVEAFDKEYSKLKKDKALLDFNDLEYYALQILNNTTLQQAIKKRYKYVFIDEYQDTNNLQEQILSRVTSNNNAFMVGDVKQSIYMFRECDPQIFVNKYEKYKTDSNSLKIDLNKNFRSEKAVLDFANFVFSNIMQANTASVDYKNTASFVAGASYKEKTNKLPFVSVNIIDDKEFKNLKVKDEQKEEKVYSVLDDHNKLTEQTSSSKEASLATIEARIIAGKIKDFLQTKIYNTDQKEYSDVQFKDIAILTRVRGDYIKTLCSELESFNIPVNAKYYRKVYKTYEASLINNYLRLINNLQDDIALTSVLTSNMFNVTYDQLSSIRIQNQDKEYFYQAVFNYIQNNKSSNVTIKVKAMLKDLEHFRSQLKHLTMPELITKILEKYDLNNYFYSLPNGKERVENIKMLINASKKPQLENNLFKYVDYIETYADTEEFEITSNTTANSVTVTTIHSSKGLEYPIVILTNAGKDFTKKPMLDEILINKDLGFGVRYYDLQNRTKTNTLARNVISLKNKTQELAEEMRLFYVAITRAKNHLVLVGKTNLQKLKSINTTYSVKSAKSYLEWVLGSLSNVQLNTIQNNSQSLNLKLNNNATFEFEVCKLDNLIEKEIEPKKLVFGKPDNIYLNAFEKVFNFEYAYKNSLDILTKSSVTEVSQQQEENINNYSIKKFKTNEVYNLNEELDFSLIGSVYHLVMEHISFKNTTLEHVKTQITNLINNKVLPQNTFELVDCKKILTAIVNLKQLFNSADKVLKEQQFMMYIPYKDVFKNSQVEDKILIQGIIDLIIIKGSEVIILDYKTSRINKSENLVKKYATQLNLYKKAWDKANSPKVTKKLIYSFHLNNTVNV